MKSCFIVFLLCLSLTGHARQDPAAVKAAIAEFLRIQVQGLPGDTSFTIGELDSANQLQPCARLDVFVPPGTRLWGKSTVAVRCSEPSPWTQFVAVQVRVVASYLVASHTLPGGQPINAGDFAQRSGDLTTLPTGVVTEPGQAIGRIPTMTIVSGMPLRSDLLRQVMVVQQGQAVKAVSGGNGFQVENEGTALNSAGDGQIVRVRLPNGRVVSGIARTGGLVEISY